LELWTISFDNAKVVIQEEVKFATESTQKIGAPKTRKKQCSVMLLDCSNLNWDIEQIVQEMDAGQYDYNQLMHEMCILDESEVKFGVPFEWNSLEHYDSKTKLIHYTDVYTQPWAECGNKFGHFWLDEVRLMLADGTLKWGDLQREIDLGYFRPSLIRDIKCRHLIPSFLVSLFDKKNAALDTLSGYMKHKEVYEAKRVRRQAIKEYEERMNRHNASIVSDISKV
jgi:hypothetical protein